MADRKLFYDDPSLERVETVVVETGESEGRPWVRLDETVFYPEGGGQPADRGTIEGVEVIDVRSVGATVLHFLAAPLGRGSVTAAIDGARRFDFRQQHTAQHLLTALLADRERLETTSFHLGEEYAAIEVRGAVPAADALARFEREANALLREDRAVRTTWVDPGELGALSVRSRGLPDGHIGPVRLVEIEGIDRNTCGGTHVTRLAEIQAIHLIDAEGARGGARIRFLAGGRVFRELRRLEAGEETVRRRLGTGPAEFAAVLDSRDAERARGQRRVRSLEEQLAQALAAEIAGAPGGRLARFVPGAGPELVRAIAAATVARRPEALVVVVGASERGDEACFAVEAGPRSPDEARELGERVRDALGARGGGKGRRFQGTGGTWRPGALPEELLPS